MIPKILNKLMTNAVCEKVDFLLAVRTNTNSKLPPMLNESLREFKEFANSVAASCKCLHKSCAFCVEHSPIGRAMYMQYKAILARISLDESKTAKPIIDALDCIVIYLERYVRR